METDTWAYVRLVTKAEELRKREPELTEAEAISKAADLFPELAQEHQEEIRKAIG